MTRSDKREAILQAAERVFRHRRFHEVTLEEVAALAHVGKGTIYNYFRDKDDLFFQLATEGSDELCDAIYRVAASRQSVRDKLYAICEAVSEFSMKRHAVMRAVQIEDYIQKKPAFREKLHRHLDRLREATNQVFEEGVRQGVIRDDVDTALLDCLLSGGLRARGFRMAHGGEDIPVRRLVDLFLDGAAPRRRGPERGGGRGEVKG